MRIRHPHHVSLALCLATVLLAAGVAAADGLVVPTDPKVRVRGDWYVKYHRVDMRVRDQVASVSIDQAFVNNGKRRMEVEYLFPVPPGAAIDSMTLLVDGKEFTAKLMKADEARRIYESIVRAKKDPALLEYVGYGMYKTSAFPLDPGKDVRVQVTYKQICRKDGDMVDVWYPLNTEKYSARPIEEVSVTVDIRGKGDILAPYSPTHDITVERKSTHHVIVSYKAAKVLPTEDFQVYYKQTGKDVGATLVTHMSEDGKDGYFLMLVSPNPRTAKTRVWPKDVVVVLDHSGSMNGKKMRQAKEALGYILQNLNPKDRFNVVIYSDEVESFYDGLVKVSKAQIEDAVQRVDAIDATGGTNIHEALSKAMACLPDNPGKARPQYVLFVTDGLATVGVTDEKVILRDTKKANDSGARIFSFGVGYDVNVRLLDKLAGENHGRSAYIKKDEPVGPTILSLYNKIKNPVMTNLAVKMLDVRLRETYPRTMDDLFEGDQVVLVGRYDCKDAAALENGRTTQLVITGQYQGKQRGFEYPVTLRAAGKDARYAFVEKLWATRRVGFLLDQIQLNGKSKEVLDELVKLSLKYGIMTPYTSFLADERTQLSSRRDQHKRAREATAPLAGRTTGGMAQADAANRAELKDAARPKSAGGGYAAEEQAGYGNEKSYRDGKKADVANVRNFSDQAVYQRGTQWVAANAADLDPEKDKNKIQDIERYSKEYFELVRTNSRAMNRILASQRDGEQLLIRMQGRAYNVR